MNNRRTWSAEDRMQQKEIEDSLKTSNNLMGVVEALQTGNMDAAKGYVPNYKSPTAAEAMGGLAHETGGLSMDMQSLFTNSQQILGEDGTAQAASQAYPNANQNFQKTAQSQPQNQAQMPQVQPGYKVSQNQFNAIRKFPALVEFLGTENGDKIAQRILSDMNTLVVDQIEKNSKLIDDNARMCIAKKQNIHQFFQGEGWVCQVTASGPFTGNEAIYYHSESDKSYVLRNYGGTKYRDVTDSFNVVHDYRTIEEEGVNDES